MMPLLPSAATALALEVAFKTTLMVAISNRVMLGAGVVVVVVVVAVVDSAHHVKKTQSDNIQKDLSGLESLCYQ